MRRKTSRIHSLLSRVDFVAVQETHSTEGRADAEETMLPPGTRAFWAHGDRRTAGIALLVKEDFLGRFAALPPRWEILDPGRAGRLSLCSQEGRLDTVVVYYHASDPYSGRH